MSKLPSHFQAAHEAQNLTDWEILNFVFVSLSSDFFSFYMLPSGHLTIAIPIVFIYITGWTF